MPKIRLWVSGSVPKEKYAATVPAISACGIDSTWSRISRPAAVRCSAG